jgi:uncharacterized iron-regulated protein
MPPTTRRLTTLLASFLAACATNPPAPSPAQEAYQSYRESFQASAGTSFVANRSRDELVAALGAARVLWLGDHHASSRLHGLQFELLEQLRRRGLRMTFVLEAVGTQDGPSLQQYLAGESTIEELRTRMRKRWPGSWLDDTDLDPFFYRSLLAFGKQHQIPVAPLEPTPRGPLATRDEAMAKVVQAHAAAHPDRLVVVVVGQAHLLGQGDLVHRTNLPWLAIGGEPPVGLRSAPFERKRYDLLQSDSGLFWFGELCRDPR